MGLHMAWLELLWYSRNRILQCHTGTPEFSPEYANTLQTPPPPWRGVQRHLQFPTNKLEFPAQCRQVHPPASWIVSAITEFPLQTLKKNHISIKTVASKVTTMPNCGICGKKKLIKHYKELGSCAKCSRKRTSNPQMQCISCLCHFSVCTSSCDLCVECAARKKQITQQRPELVVKQFIEKEQDLPPCIHNRADPITRTHCSRSRVDFRLDFTYFQVIIEVDENQHKSYGETCELTRLPEVVNAGGGIPLVIFRINPDKYRQNGRLQNTPLHDRLVFMEERILMRSKKITRRIQKSTLRSKVLPILYVEYLFFDEDSSDKNYAIRTYFHDRDIVSTIQKCQWNRSYMLPHTIPLTAQLRCIYNFLIFHVPFGIVHQKTANPKLPQPLQNCCDMHIFDEILCIIKQYTCTYCK